MKHHHLDLAEDEFLLFQKGDHRVFQLVFNRFFDQIQRYVSSMIQNKQEVDDITQQCFVQLYTNKTAIREPSALYPYLFVIARRLVISSFRRRVLETKYLDEQVPTTERISQSTQKQIDYNELQHVLSSVIDILPPKQREIYRLNKLDGYSYEEISIATGCSKNTVKNHLITASKKVREFISRYYLTFLSFFLLLH